MKKNLRYIAIAIVSFYGGYTLNTKNIFETNTKLSFQQQPKTVPKDYNPKLGAFSISLNVKDLKASQEFYHKLGFVDFGGNIKNNYLILKNQNALIGIFKGFFKGNILTFNPGWDENAKNTKQFNDVREIQKILKTSSIKLSAEVSDSTKGPGFITLTDPDGNEILIDQHR